MVIIGFHTGAGSALTKSARIALEELSKTVVQNCRDLMGANPELTAAELAVQVMTLLENTPLTNCGFGSELTIDGIVECDACMVQCSSGRRIAGAVGSLAGIKNPVQVCQKLIQRQLECSSEIGRAEPGFLVSTAAKQFALDNELPLANLETPRARRVFDKWRKVFDQFQAKTAEKTTDMHTVTDTVGVFVIATADDFACCSSSGGILLKSSGRIGPAALPGSGADISVRHKSVALTSGFGEDIITCMLARCACQNQAALDEIIKALQSEIYFQRPDPYVGILRAQIADDGSQVFVDYFHSTESMCITIYDSKLNRVKQNFGNSSRSSSGGWALTL